LYRQSENGSKQQKNRVGRFPNLVGVALCVIASHSLTYRNDEISSLQKRLLEQFGGLTFFPQPNQGFWKMGAVIYRDESRYLSSARDLIRQTDARFGAHVARLKGQQKKGKT
jgi:hypothetical protein